MNNTILVFSLYLSYEINVLIWSIYMLACDKLLGNQMWLETHDASLPYSNHFPLITWSKLSSVITSQNCDQTNPSFPNSNQESWAPNTKLCWVMLHTSEIWGGENWWWSGISNFIRSVLLFKFEGKIANVGIPRGDFENQGCVKVQAS